MGCSVERLGKIIEQYQFPRCYPHGSLWSKLLPNSFGNESVFRCSLIF